jgi:succinate dehydrogenase/fumarate reductase flavoprotein subunit
MITESKIDASPTDGDSYDLIVVGSGAGGLSAAVTAAHLGMRVAVLEKEPVLGGTTAWSGGWLWIPRNPLAVEAGIEEPISAPMQYLESIMGNRAKDPRITQFLETGPEMVRFFREETAVDWDDGNMVPDFIDVPGAKGGGRSVCAAAYDGRALGPWISKLRAPLGIVSIAGMGVASGKDMRHFFNATRRFDSMLYVLKRLLRHGIDLTLHRKGMQLVNGNALVARLMKSALDMDVALFTDSPVRTLLHGQQGVTGVVLESGAKLMAKSGVVLATGGFPHDKELQNELFDPETGSQHYSSAPRSNTGDGLKLGRGVGAMIESDLANGGAWAPVSVVPDRKDGAEHFPHLVERAKPGIIAVSGQGRRFTNEADSYHIFVRALIDATPKDEQPFCWLIADHAAQRRWGLGWSRPLPFPLLTYRRGGYLTSGRTLHELAEKCDLDPLVLAETVANFNAGAERGEDPVFGRGASRYNKAQGDTEHKPNPALGPLTKGPFHAVKIFVGSLGTFSGMASDRYARVLDHSGQPIAGLYAAGNDLSSIFAGYYPSGGITLGPAMTFGFIAAQTAAGRMGQNNQNTQTPEGGFHATV